MAFGDSNWYLSNNFPDFTEHGSPLCAETDPELFFPPDEFNVIDPRVSTKQNVALSIQKGKEAIKICSKCPYKSECFNYAVSRPELMGIWGGTTQEGRKRIRNLK